MLLLDRQRNANEMPDSPGECVLLFTQEQDEIILNPRAASQHIYSIPL